MLFVLGLLMGIQIILKNLYKRKKKKEIAILKWANDNDVDLLDFGEIKKLYYSLIFKKITGIKGKEYKEIYNLNTLEQGVFKHRSEKSKSSYDPKNFYKHSLNVIYNSGNKSDISFFENNNLSYKEIHNLAMNIATRDSSAYFKRFKYYSTKFGEFNLRSKLEKGFLFIADRLDGVKNIEYETVKIRYSNNRLYTIDFMVETDNSKFLVEVKPYSQYIIPEGLILDKKIAAEKFVKNSKEFSAYIFITEKDVRYGRIKEKFNISKS